jgi:hypothetical protein
MSVTFNPSVTTSPQNSFLAQTKGLVQGTFLDDPAARMWLQQGYLLAGQTPIFGGVPITELVPASTGDLSLGPAVEWSASMAATTGFAVFNQAHAMLIAPGANVPVAGAGMSVNIIRLGTNAKIVVPIDSTLATTIDGNAINTAVTWDFTNNCLVAFNTTAFPCKILEIEANSLIISVQAGVANWASGSVALIQI